MPDIESNISVAYGNPNVELKANIGRKGNTVENSAFSFLHFVVQCVTIDEIFSMFICRGCFSFLCGSIF